jgi:hypothetical protein
MTDFFLLKLCFLKESANNKRKHDTKKENSFTFSQQKKYRKLCKTRLENVWFEMKWGENREL